MQFKNMWLHFKKICKHKYWVGRYCFKMGLYWQGIAHDLSKFSPSTTSTLHPTPMTSELRRR